MWNEIYWQYRYPEMHIYLSSRTKHLVSSCRRKQHLKCPILTLRVSALVALTCRMKMFVWSHLVLISAGVPTELLILTCPTPSHRTPSRTQTETQKEQCEEMMSTDRKWCTLKNMKAPHILPFNILFLPLIKFMVQWWNFHFIYLVS